MPEFEEPSSSEELERHPSSVYMVLQQAQDVSHDSVENALQNELPINQVHNPARRPIMVELVLNGLTLSMQVDTEAAVSLILSATFTQLFPNAALSKSGAVLTTYTGEQIHCTPCRSNAWMWR